MRFERRLAFCRSGRVGGVVRRTPLVTAACLVAVSLASVRVAEPQTLADVPGTAVYWRISPASIAGFGLPPNRIYTTSPSIVVLPNGEYLLSFNLFGSDLVPPAETSGTTYIYRSSDRGESWTELTPMPMMDMKRGSLFRFGADVFLWGYSAAPGSIVIRRSSDNGSSWTAPVDDANGLLTRGNYGGTPHDPVVHAGRLWTAVAGKRLMSVATNRDFLDASRWAGPSAAADTEASPLGPGLTITEAQIVASPGTGVVVLPKVEGLPYTVLIRANGNASVADPTDADWVPLPGAEKKFGAAYDPVSQRFYVLSNPVLPAHEGTLGILPELIRNTAAMLSSEDLLHWNVEQIFLYSPNIAYEGFQYLNFDFDGDDLVVASRTAFDLTGEPGVDYKPPRGHDSNLITFHRIPDFRTATPRHRLTADGNQVWRQERTQHADAPLGSFVLGRAFAGAPLGMVNGLAHGADGEVLVREESGRVLRFDPLGNFLGLGSDSGVTFARGLDPVVQPGSGERGWTATTGGDWETLANWYYWNRPDTDVEVANFGTAIGTASTITLDRPWRVRGLRFRSLNSYSLGGSGAVVLGADGGPAFVEVHIGEHAITVPFQLVSSASIEASMGTTLSVEGGMDIAGYRLGIRGEGTMRVGQSLALRGGVLALDGGSRVHFAAATTNDLRGTLEWGLDRPGTAFRSGDRFSLFENIGATVVSNRFTNLVLPALAPGLGWDVSALYTTGTLSVAPLGCGNGVVTLDEVCDYGNSLDGDCCHLDCLSVRPNGSSCAADASICTADVCDAFGVCTHQVPPNPSCQPSLASRGLLQIAKSSNPAKDRVAWKWRNAAAVAKVPDFGAPISGPTSFTFCVFDAEGTLLLDLTAEAGGICGSGSCWKDTQLGYRYRDSALEPNGVLSVGLREGFMPGHATLRVDARGAAFRIPALPIRGLPVRARLMRSDAASCWESEHSMPLTNDGDRFRARSD